MNGPEGIRPSCAKSTEAEEEEPASREDLPSHVADRLELGGRRPPRPARPQVAQHVVEAVHDRQIAALGEKVAGARPEAEMYDTSHTDGIKMAANATA